MSNRFGNWVSPSYARKLGVEYGGASSTGGLYRGLLEEVWQQMGELNAYGGYTGCKLNDLYWMQGEGNRMLPYEYRKAFAFWAEDIRRGLADLMRELTSGIDDCGASELPIFVGTNVGKAMFAIV